MVNASTLSSLKAFFSQLSELTASNLVLIPALHQVIEHEMLQGSTVSMEIIGVCQWLFTQAYAVFKGLSRYGLPEIDHTASESNNINNTLSWKEVWGDDLIAE